MFTFNLRNARKQKRMTQRQVADRMGVSQAYVSMLEGNKRRVPSRQLAKVVGAYGLSASALPFHGSKNWDRVDGDKVATELGTLGYPGFAYMRVGRPKWNPAELLLAALTKDDLETRVTEGLPWLAYTHSDMDWDWVVREAKNNNVTNRLGFVVTLARELAERKGDTATVARLRAVEARLQPCVLLHPRTLCREHMTQAERRWLSTRSTPQARQWNVLSDLSLEHLAHAT
ncbi:MAG TPA: helix-turn-helix transcriptional regulator [Candidatus Angelobacter sp.]